MARIGLISRLALLVVAIEIAAYSALGWLYTDRFSAAAEERLRSRMHQVAQMVAADELALSAVAQLPLLGNLVGAPCLEGVVIGGSGRIIVSSDPAYLGRPAGELPGFDAGWLAPSAPDEQVVANDDTLTSVTQIRGPAGGATIYRTVLTVSTTELNAQKRAIALRGYVVSALFVLISSLGIIAVAQRLITRRVDTSLAILKRVEGGALEARIPVSSHDELGQLQNAINSMTAKVGALLDRHRRNEEEIRTVMNAMADGIIAVAPDGAIMRCNRAAAELLDHPHDACAGKDILALLPELAPQTSEGWWTAPDSRTAAGRLRIERQGPEADSRRTIELGHGPIKDADGTVVGAVLVLQDVTARIEGELKLRHAVERLTVSNSELERFAYVASHDLQEPLRTIVSFTQLLDRRIGGTLSEEDRENFTFIVEAAKRMSLLIRDLLAYSRVNTGGTRFTAVPLRHACNAALDNLRDAISESGAEVEVGPLPEVPGDAVQLMQLFQNLIGNAIKYRRPGMAPRITVSAARHEGEWRVSVADNGIGIAETDQDIFEIFRRLHPAASYAGTGVGLAICKRIVHRHNGRIWYDSRPGEGSTFHFTLPTATPERAIPAQV